MRVGIEAINLYMGGGQTHILNILSNFDIEKHKIEKVVIWARQELLDKIENYSWLEKRTHPDINKGLIFRYKWLLLNSKLEFAKNCDVLFAPSGLYFGNFKPFITMSRNMLFFDENERKRFNIKLQLKILLSRLFQSISFKKAAGIIFISKYAQQIIVKEFALDQSKCVKIYHGISKKFKPSSARLESIEMKILYVSHVYPYKHTWNVVEAISLLVSKGYRIRFDIVGGGDTASIKRLNNSINKVDPNNAFIIYHGSQPYENMHYFYKTANIFVYASTCENMPNSLLEAMMSELPIACSNSEPMPEFLKDAGIYFNSESINEIAVAIEKLILSPTLRMELSCKATEYASHYDWKLTAEQTFAFIENTYKNSHLYL